MQAERVSETGRVEQGSEAFAQRDGVLVVVHRQHLTVPPHGRHAVAQRLTAPRPGAREIVAREQRRAAATQMVPLQRVERGRAARPRAFQVREVGHVWRRTQAGERGVDGAYKLKTTSSSVSEQILILLLVQLVDGLDVLIGYFLYFVETPPLVILGDQMILQQLLEPLVRVAANDSQRVAALF